MSKGTPGRLQVRIADLKANLSRYLRAAQRGEVVTVYDRSTPIAQVVPMGTGEAVLVIRRATQRRASSSYSPPAGWEGTDSLAMLRGLREDR